jgi:hypothetical protein
MTAILQTTTLLYSSEQPLTWLQLKKAHKASTSSAPSIRHTSSEELDNFVRSYADVSDDVNPHEWWARTKQSSLTWLPLLKGL